MSKYIDTVKSQSLAEAFFDNIQELISGGAFNFRLTQASATMMRVPSGTGHDQAGISIGGIWRYSSSNVDATFPGGASDAWYDVWAITNAPNIVSTVSEDTDTEVAFTLAITATASPPAAALKRKVGQVYWDGSKIIHVKQLLRVGSPADELWLSPQTVDHTPLTIDLASGHQGFALRVLTNGSQVFSVSSQGQVVGDSAAFGDIDVSNIDVSGNLLIDGGAMDSTDLSDGASIAHLAGPTFTGTVKINNAAGATNALSVTGHGPKTGPAWFLNSAGTQLWGPGDGTTDTTLTRTAVGTLSVGGALRVSGGIGLFGGAAASRPSGLGDLDTAISTLSTLDALNNWVPTNIRSLNEAAMNGLYAIRNALAGLNLIG